ncbi:PfkB family carbohydrate kinase [Sphingomonas sp.]|uniref:PfkB family carbohydrate kinase n=1 Tax=Sphingomonas sp. TaxID=28214 RepID=UPI002D80EFBC|nr:PfkB family carbohydrate kinase [Sphingomonas sp.]HEU0043972.1 PfkB family carbohydrate kinase [Sphingomonas sp.]
MVDPRSGGQVLVAGSANADMVVRAARIPAPGETVLGGDLTVNPGGKGANQAVAAARAGGARTAMLLALGQDPAADLLQRSLTEAGVTLHVVRSTRPTGAALITVSDTAENAITVAPGANATLAREHLPELAKVEWLVMQLETPIETVTAYAQAAQAAGVGVMLNVAPARAVPDALLAATDVLVANEEELAIIAGSELSIVDRLASLDVPIAIVTLGARGCCAWHSAGMIVQPAFRVEAVDTTAAGDTFCGALVAAFARGDALPLALRTASAAAALATTRPGAQVSIPTRAEVDALLATDGDSAGDVAELARFCGLPIAWIEQTGER